MVRAIRQPQFTKSVANLILASLIEQNASMKLTSPVYHSPEGNLQIDFTFEPYKTAEELTEFFNRVEPLEGITFFVSEINLLQFSVTLLSKRGTYK